MRSASRNSLYLNKEFYGIDSVQKAIAEFKEYLGADVLATGAYLAVQVEVRSHYHDYAHTILHEFLNYTLDLSLKAYFGDDP